MEVVHICFVKIANTATVGIVVWRQMRAQTLMICFLVVMISLGLNVRCGIILWTIKYQKGA